MWRNVAYVICLVQAIQYSLAARAGRSSATVSWGAGSGDFDIAAALLDKPSKVDTNSSSKIASNPCGTTIIVTSKDDKHERCPDACPFYVSNKLDDKACSFVCIPADECSKYNPKTPIADPKMGVCRAPMVSYCAEYEMGESDRCAKCEDWYYLWKKNGKCYSRYVITLCCIAGVLLIVVLLLVVWIVDICIRPVTNLVGLAGAENFRESQKLHQPKRAGQSRQPWPLTTNLLTTQVAGPGMILHFNFQMGVIVWALLVSLGWVILGLAIDGDLFILGTRKFGTPRQNCILVAWGYETQQRLMWTKVGFLYWVYVGTFTACLAHSVRQLRLFQHIDYSHKTMKDFVAMISGLPALEGSTKLEEAVKRTIADDTNQKVVGVSVAWDYSENEDTVMKALERDLRHEEKNAQIAAGRNEVGSTEAQDMPEMGPMRKKCFELEKKIFGEEDEPDEAASEQEILSILKSMKNSPNAFVVFETEAMRDDAVEMAQGKGGIQFEGSMIKLETIHSEPDTVQWQNFGHASLFEQIMRLIKGFGMILLALVFWTVVFYAPYAVSVFNFNYDNGQQPGPIYSITFSMVVVIGNAIMYEVCARVSDNVGFLFKDSRETCYMILYTIACSFNVILDLVTTYFTVWEIIKGLHFRTYEGTKIQHVKGFNERFESYAMQRSLAENTYAYAWPSTYLIPFLLEPLITVYVPLKLGQIIVRTHPEMLGRAAEGWLAAAPMEMGRYADIILDIILAILIFFFPGGYTHWLFFFLAAAHAWIYFFDHVRVLSVIPACTFASMDVDWWSQVMLIPCCSLILSCLVFKANRQGYGYQLEGMDITKACVTAFILHSVVHTLLLIFIVPMFGVKPPQDSELNSLTYRDIGTQMAATWFSTNPVHCLRSSKIYKHSPPCGYVISGKEHMLKVNEEIGCFFHDDPITVPAKAASGTGSWLAGFKSPGGALFGGNKA